MRLIRTGAGACVVVTVLAGCGGGDDGGGSGGGGGEVADGGTFSMAMDADPGNIDPQGQNAASNNVIQLGAFAYDPLIHLDADGQVVTGLAEEWQVEGQTITLTIRQDVTCADGAPFTATDAADNINYVADPANQSPLLGLSVPGEAVASAEGSTVTVTLAAPAPFALEGMALLPMVCRSGLDDRSVLAQETRGTGPFQLEEVLPGDNYTFSQRADYTWGPDGASTAEAGMPDTVSVRIVPNLTTAANLLLSGELSAATVIGPDSQRLDGSDLFSVSTPLVLGEMWFNQLAERPGSDPAVRTALAQGVDLEQVQQVLTSGNGTNGTTFAVLPPVACPGESVPGALPEYDVEAAAAALDDAGWVAGPDGTRARNGTPLAITFIHNSGNGAPGAAAAELATAAWEELGVTVEAQAQDDTAFLDTVFGSGNWDVAWLTLNVFSPDQLVPFVSGPAPADGNNFASIDNATYNAKVAEATQLQSTEGCDAWLEAEASLVSEADVIPFANQTTSTYGSNAEFASGSVAVVPTSIRMLAG